VPLQCEQSRKANARALFVRFCPYPLREFNRFAEVPLRFTLVDSYELRGVHARDGLATPSYGPVVSKSGH
jgi:hypothetical protein